METSGKFDINSSSSWFKITSVHFINYLFHLPLIDYFFSIRKVIKNETSKDEGLID